MIPYDAAVHHRSAIAMPLLPKIVQKNETTALTSAVTYTAVQMRTTGTMMNNGGSGQPCLLGSRLRRGRRWRGRGS